DLSRTAFTNLRTVASIGVNRSRSASTVVCAPTPTTTTGTVSRRTSRVHRRSWVSKDSRNALANGSTTASYSPLIWSAVASRFQCVEHTSVVFVVSVLCTAVLKSMLPALVPVTSRCNVVSGGNASHGSLPDRMRILGTVQPPPRGRKWIHSTDKGGLE